MEYTLLNLKITELWLDTSQSQGLSHHILKHAPDVWHQVNSEISHSLFKFDLVSNLKKVEFASNLLLASLSETFVGQRSEPGRRQLRGNANC